MDTIVTIGINIAKRNLFALHDPCMVSMAQEIPHRFDPA